MKFLSLVLVSVLFLTLTTAGQSESCLFDLNQNQLRKSPSFVQAELAFNNLIKTKSLQSKSRIQSMAVAAEEVVEIPVVVHVIYKSSESAIGTPSNPSDQDIHAAITKLNNDYAGIGTDPNSAKVPIRFVLAKRSPDNKSTTGINRVNGGSLSGYNDYGVAYPASGFAAAASEASIRGLAKWDHQLYYNIWVVWRIQSKPDGTGNALGYAYSPLLTGISSFDGLFVKTTEISSTASTLTHELGHALGLYHTFEGSISSCAPNTDCSNTGDRVCDTDPVKQLSGGICYKDTDPNECNGNKAFNGIQRNFMGYSSCYNMFTQGQKARMVTSLNATRSSQINSPGLTPPSCLVNATQKPQDIVNTNNSNDIGPYNIYFGDLIYTSKGYSGDGFKFYKDNTCDLGTSLSNAQNHTISISTEKSTQRVKAWIDFNNNGTLESSELILNSNNNGKAVNYTHTGTITSSQLKTISASSTRQLRLRVMSDMYSSPDFNADTKLQYGQTEDFWVTVENPLSVVFGNLSAKQISNNQLSIEWSTSSETNNDHFIIEGSSDGSNFTKITTVKSKTTDGNSSNTLNYSIQLNSQSGLLASAGILVLLFAIISAAAFKKRKMVFAAVIGLVFFTACSKTDQQQIHSDDEIKFIRITQVDKNGTKNFSKVIKIVKD